ncbi:TolC family protein [Dyadobacter sp. LHD-138]|uniref:TolC family protein n=1 Tax=Dyadobacter sp. LHD-138 TaxID=3071413 RepID=UPI0027E19949|nr:TolC family protein [Dyadobacter sp. LHD-138]MDQ6478163.1 TolC family protein [Dyadobacter sp. LHD-138]
MLAINRKAMHFRAIIITAIVTAIWIFEPVSAQNQYNLQQALQATKTNNPMLKKEQLNVNIAETDIVTASLRPNPILNNQSLQLVKASKFPDNTGWGNHLNRQVWWQVTKPFEMPQLRKNKIDFANQNVILNQKAFKETERNLFQDVASKWLDVWSARKQLDILNIAKNNIDSLVIINKVRLKNQVITTTDLARTELLANQYKVQMKSADQNYKNEITNLKYLMGIQDDVNVDTTDNFQFAFPANVDDLLQQALQSRSDIQTLKSTIDVANANIKLQKSMALPVPELGAIFNPQNGAPYLGVYGTIAIPIFSRNQGEIRKSKVLKQQAEQDLLATQSLVQSEISTAFSSYQTQKQNLLNFTGLLTQSQTILNNVKYAYLRGGTTIIDFLEAQRSWLDTQQQYYETLQLYRQSYIKLLYASGIINQIAQ